MNTTGVFGGRGWGNRSLDERFASARGPSHSRNAFLKIDDISRGVAVTIACAAQGIHRDTFYSWLDEKPEFAVKLAARKRDVIVEAIAGIRTGSKNDEWRGHAWFLEHVYPDHYAPPAPGIALGVQQNFTITIEKAKEIQDMRAKLLPEVNQMLGLPNGGPNGDSMSLQER